MQPARLVPPLWALFAAACGSPTPKGAEAPRPPSALAARSEQVARLLPLRAGHVYAYDSEDVVSGEKGSFVTEIRDAGPSKYQLVTAGRSKVLEVLPDGVRRADSERYLLKTPLVVGAHWMGNAGGQVSVTSIDKQVAVAAGMFVGCVETVEQGAELSSTRTTTTYCPDVGVTVLEVEQQRGGQAAHEKASLRSWGPSIDLGGKRE